MIHTADVYELYLRKTYDIVLMLNMGHEYLTGKENLISQFCYEVVNRRIISRHLRISNEQNGMNEAVPTILVGIIQLF